jgi:hypothetical protein
LKDAGITDAKKLQEFAIRIASDPEVGVRRFDHHINLNEILPDLEQPDITTTQILTDKLLELSAGKLCSNGHEQEWPYPTECEQCGAPVP